MRDLSVNIVFCDDARREADGRFSVMGVFDGVRIVPEGITALPKVTICAFVSAPQGLDLSEVVIKVAIVRGGAVEHEDSYPAMPLVAEVDPQWAKLISAAEISFPLRAHFAGILEFQNFPMHDACVLQVSTYRGSELLFEHGTVLLPGPGGSTEAKPKKVALGPKVKSAKKQVAR